MKNRESIALNASRWTAYSAAGIAAATAGTMTSEAEAGITVIESNTAIANTSNPGYFDAWSFSFGGGAGFALGHAIFSSAPGVGVMIGSVFGGAAAAGTYNGYAYPSNLAYGANLSTQLFSVIGGDRGDMAWGSGYPNSNFINSGVSYLGFRFDIGAGTQYGWAQLDMDDNNPLNTGTLVRFAYADAGESLTVGQVPAPGSIAALAMGAAGLGGFRRRRSA